MLDYRQVVTSFRRVYLITPHSSEVPEALAAVAELYTEMGERFGKSYYQLAVDTYQFLLREYPSSRFGADATLLCAKIQRDELGEAAEASKTYAQFLKRYPRSPRKREAQEALAELALLQNNEKSAPAKTALPPAMAAVKTAAGSETLADAEPEDNAKYSGGMKAESGVPRIRRVRASANTNSTRVTIDLEDTVEYVSGRLSNPDRIFFDLRGARLTPEVAREPVLLEGPLLVSVRVAKNHAGVVRLVLEVDGVKDYSASLSGNPPQLAIDLYGKTAAPASVKTAKLKRAARENELAVREHDNGGHLFAAGTGS